VQFWSNDYESTSTRTRAPVTPGAQRQVATLIEARDFAVERVDPTLEDAFLGLSHQEFRAMTQ
jgi:hypothetical protein